MPKQIPPTFPGVPGGATSTMPMQSRLDWQLIVAQGIGVLLLLAGAALVITAMVIA